MLIPPLTYILYTKGDFRFGGAMAAIWRRALYRGKKRTYGSIRSFAPQSQKVVINSPHQCHLVDNKDANIICFLTPCHIYSIYKKSSGSGLFWVCEKIRVKRDKKLLDRIREKEDVITWSSFWHEASLLSSSLSGALHHPLHSQRRQSCLSVCPQYTSLRRDAPKKIMEKGMWYIYSWKIIVRKCNQL